MGFFKKLLKIAKVVAPIALAVFAPGVGTAIGTALGATGAAASAVGGAVLGGGIGAVGGGGIKGTLTGAALGGVGGYISGSGGLAGAAQNLDLGKTGLPIAGVVGPQQATGLAGLISNTSGSFGTLFNRAGSILPTTGSSGISNLGKLALAGSVYSGVSGANAVDKATGQQVAAGQQAVGQQQEALSQIRSDLQPYTSSGATTTPLLTSLVNDPAAQLSFLQNNPFYNTLAEKAKNDLLAREASRGKVGSGGTASALQNAYLLLGKDLLQSDISSKQNLVSTGLNAAGQGVSATKSITDSISNLTTDVGANRAAGTVGASNVERDAIENALGTAATLYGINRGVFV